MAIVKRLYDDDTTSWHQALCKLALTCQRLAGLVRPLFARHISITPRNVQKRLDYLKDERLAAVRTFEAILPSWETAAAYGLIQDLINVHSLTLATIPTVFKIPQSVRSVRIEGGPVRTLRLSAVIIGTPCIRSWISPARLIVDSPQPRLDHLVTSISSPADLDDLKITLGNVPALTKLGLRCDNGLTLVRDALHEVTIPDSVTELNFDLTAKWSDQFVTVGPAMWRKIPAQIEHVSLDARGACELPARLLATLSHALDVSTNFVNLKSCAVKSSVDGCDSCTLGREEQVSTIERRCEDRGIAFEAIESSFRRS